MSAQANATLKTKSLARRRTAADREPEYNAETYAALLECEAMLASGNYKVYNSYAELEADILAEMEEEDKLNGTL